MLRRNLRGEVWIRRHVDPTEFCAAVERSRSLVPYGRRTLALLASIVVHLNQPRFIAV